MLGICSFVEIAIMKEGGFNSLFHSQNFLLHINDFGVFGFTVGPGTRKRQIKKMSTAGTTKDKMTRRVVEICEGTYG
jgi:hypothetical protein